MAQLYSASRLLKMFSWITVTKRKSKKTIMEEEIGWERPKSVPIPTVWARYESRKTMPNGRAPKFRIQDYTDEFRDLVVHNMCNFFIRDEPLSRYLDIYNDPASMEEFKELVSGFLKRKMGLVAIVENLDELGNENLPILAGYNITGVVTVSEKHKEAKAKKMKIIFDALNALEELVNPFKYYDTNEYMYALGLSVDPAYRGHGLGREILKARFPLCKACGIKATVTAFTAIESQKSAENAGFETLTEIAYADYKDENGEVVFKLENPKTMKLMGKRIL